MLKNNSFKPTPIPHRSKFGEPMRYFVLSEDCTETKVTRAECLAPDTESDNPFPQRWFVDEESGLVIRLPRTAKSDEIARENMRSVWREAKRKERWTQWMATPTLDDEDGKIVHEIVDTSAQADVAGIVEEKAILDTLYAALATLAQEDLDLIKDTFWRGKTERQIASDVSLSQKTINKRKQKLLGRLAENEALKKFYE